MKSERFFELLDDTDDALLQESERPTKERRTFALKVAAIAACFALSFTLLLNVLMYAGMGSQKADSIYPEDNGYKDFSNEAWGGDAAKPGGDSASDSNAAFEVKIIRTATLQAETKSYDAATKALMEAISAAGGYVSDSSERNQNGTARHLTMTIRIPAEKLDGFLAGLGGDLLLTEKTVSSDDVTLSYYDIASRLETLRAERTALSAMLEKATTTSDILAIQKQLYNVIEEIESLETQLCIYNDKVAYATVQMTLREVTLYTPEEEATFGEKAGLAFSESWKSFADFWASFCIGVISALPVLLVILVIVSGVLLALLGWRRKNAKKKAQSTEKD